MLCKYPMHIEKAGGIVPCGQCHHCRQNLRRKKTSRLVLESQMHEHIIFLTLTYSEAFLPRQYVDPVTGEYFSHDLGVLDKRAIQLFLKRLRKSLPPRSLRYFACGEYGTIKSRPHYHLVLFGLPYNKRSKEKILDAWRDPDTGELMADPKYIDIQQPRKNSDVAQYVCSYVMKKMTRADDPRLKGRPPEFFLQSKGIARGATDALKRLLSNATGTAHAAENLDIPRSYKLDGKSYPIDRYMRQKLLEGHKLEIEIKETSQKRFSQEMQDLLNRAKENPQIPRAWIDDPKRQKWALEKQHEFENRQTMLNSEKRDQLYKKGTTL